MFTHKSSALVKTASDRSLTISPLLVTALVSHSGEQASHKFIEYFIGQIRNPNTRQAYAQAVRQFLNWCEGQGTYQLSW